MQSRNSIQKCSSSDMSRSGRRTSNGAKQHYLQNLGMTEVARGDDGSVYLSIGYNHHDLVLRPAAQKALLHVGFQLKPHITVGDFARDVRETGLAATVKTDSQPGVAELVEVEGAGRLGHSVLRRD